MSYKDFPPFPYFCQVLRHFPEVALFYSKIWATRNDENKLAVKKSDIFQMFLVSPTVFRNKLCVLMEEGLVSFETTPNHFYLDFVDFDEDFNPSDNTYDFPNVS